MNRTRLARTVALAALALACLAGCGGGSGEPAAASSPQHGELTLTGAGGEVVVQVEIADTAAERAAGLAGRSELAADAGMLFVNDRDVRTSYWMKDTPLPLAIAFLAADGTILEILEMAPCRADPCPSYGPGKDYRSALEVNAGSFERWGIGVGDRARLEHLLIGG